ncbi:RHS repeat-associated core domain-containing protein [Elizabethkingia anophelis]|uniref:RHS repeat-associated core domain-containing protein n=2 Tax=Elizabethkingia anophelis TaxID=1117645 RepID=UPI0021A7F418|nr:RHS repeat-associated core domain-containing protein [Elizabethkingia anophelis]
MFKFKHFYTMGILMAGTLSSHAQIILTNPVTEQNKSVTDPYSIRLLPGFNAASPAVNSFRASLGASSNPNPTPNNYAPDPTASISVNENYIYSRTYLAPRSSSDPAAPQQQSISYFDGLGRPKQELSIKSTPNGNDLVTDIPYDSFGRQVQSWLPVPMGSQNGNIQSGVQAAARNHYKKADGSTDPLAYGEKTLENSPLDRVLAQAAPGSDWDGKKVQYQYQANADGEVYRYTTSTSWSNNATVSVLGLSGTYGASSLYKNVVTDEDGNSTIEFKNGQGQIVLVRKKNGSEDLDTYYVYNEYNQLAFVIPPLAVHKGVDLALLNELAYQYRYDGQNRLVEKKLPGKDWEYMVYDQQDRLVLTQDGKLRQLNKWLFTKYDKFGRVAYTGLLDSAPGRDAQQSNMVHFGGNNEERSASGFTQNGTTVYYSSSAYPVGNFTLLTVNYYDEYPPGSPGVFNGASVLGSVPVNGRSTKGLPVASMVKNIEDNGWTKSYTWYDDKARPVATESRNHLGGYTRTSSVLAFSGVPMSTTTYHKRDAASGEMVMKEEFSYDHQNRLVKHTHQVNGGLVEILTENIYNELGQLESRNIGNGIQSIKNEYNIRGALTKMNDPRNLMNKLFGFELKYINPSGTSKKYNGNIAETDWATQSDGTLRRYSYQYDGVNRLKEGNYWDNAGAISGSYAERLNYDVNGNITGLQRTGLGAGVMDQLSYTYDQSGNSNKLIRVNDASGNAAGYPVGGNTIGYDINGNMVNHLDKGISNIAYNYLNLPSSITASMGNTDYVYRADGTKVRKVFGGKTTDYLDGFQYENGVLQFVPTSEGYYDVVKNKYIYNYTDHLGNVRLSYTKGASGGAEIIEENNYYPFGLKHQGYNSSSLANNAYQYKYNGKELQETGMYDYGARMYMPELGRWGVVDPLAEKMTRHSPYNYAFNNPIRFIDPDGRAPKQIDPTQFNKKADANNKMALNELIRTTEGYNLLSRYAKAGDEVAGIKFDKDGDLHKAGVDLVLTASDSKVGGASGGTESKIINGRLKNTVNIENGSKYIGDALETQGHELFIHALPKSLDFADDKKLNLSSGYIPKQRDFLKSLGYNAQNNDAYYGIFEHYQEKQTNNANIKYISPILIQYYNKINKNVSKQAIFKTVRNFNIMSDDPRL